MRRVRRKKEATGVSLFPFLAVLICTMGALIVLLVLVVQQARVHAETVAESRSENRDSEKAQLEKLRQEEEDLVWRAEILKQQRSELTDKLADRRLELGHLEDHIRRLEEKWQQLRAEHQKLSDGSSSDADQLESMRFEIARLQAAIVTERARLAEARRDAEKRRRSFTIIPYQGPQGTRRRPIYIECTQQAIIVQPEGLVLRAEDFYGPLGPGNPLDSALRTIREYWTRIDGGTGRSGEPYPLLIVRPDGAVAYSMARAALSSWDDEFGYELVDEDMELNFPESDYRLKGLLENSVKIARQRQAMLAAAMPSRFGGQRRNDFSADDSYDGLGSDFAADHGQHASPDGTGFGPGGSQSGSAVGNFDEDGQRFAGTSGDRSQQFGGTSQDQQDAGTAARHRQPQDAVGQFNGGNAGAIGQSMASAASASDGNGGGALQSMAGQRGSDWALPNASPDATGISRPISVVCLPNQLVILPDRAAGDQRVVVPFRGSVRGTIDEFVSAVWKRIDHWGIAVAGGYWKPILKIDVAPDAEQQFRELSILLEGSGLVVEKR